MAETTWHHQKRAGWGCFNDWFEPVHSEKEEASKTTTIGDRWGGGVVTGLEGKSGFEEAVREELGESVDEAWERFGREWENEEEIAPPTGEFHWLRNL